jgi:PP-loop superfamily ATP-utilizing enzyme
MLEGIEFLLNTIGFNNPVEHVHLMEAGFIKYNNSCYLVEKDVLDMVDEFAKHTAANVQMTFGLGCTNASMMHWIQDCFHTSNDPDHNAFDELVSDIDLVNTKMKAADPGKVNK